MKIYSRERKSSEGLQGKVYMNYFFLIENESIPDELYPIIQIKVIV